MIRSGGVVGAMVVAALLLVGCGRLAGSPPASAEPSTPGPSTTATPALTATPGATPSEITGTEISIDLDAIRDGLVGPSPVPSGWEAQVDAIIEQIEAALANVSLPAVDGLRPDEAACATWEPLVGRLSWATGALVERQVMLAHLDRLAGVAPPEIAPAAQAAASAVGAAAAEQLRPDGDPEVISAAPRAELRAIGRWALEHCELPIVPDEDPDTEDWTEEDIAFSCNLDRRMLTEAMDEYRAGPGAGSDATHPHELEIAELELFVYPAWHMLVPVDDEAAQPTFEVTPIPGAFCDR